jgi:ribose 5-phosphate isomerase
MVDLDNAINGMLGVATIGIVAKSTERIIVGRKRKITRRKRRKRRMFF